MAALDLVLLPAPQKINLREGEFYYPDEGLILLDAVVPQALLAAGSLLENWLWKNLHLNWDLQAGMAVPETQQKVILRITPERAIREQGYRLHISAAQVVVEGHDPAGVYYGICTLVQLLSQFGRRVPCMEIQDWPDIPVRGVMLDVSRDKVYRMETLFELIDRLASWKINQVQLYTEHTFAYRKHPEVWKDASPVTGEEVLVLDRYCRERFIELVPNQNSFGHLHRWLNLESYAHLAENSGDIPVPWGGVMKGPFSLAPVLPESLEFISGLYDELLPHFSSRMVNIGCDETWDLGTGKSKQACEAQGTGRVYLDFLLKLYANLKARGITTQFWGDIIIQHPELVPELPHDMIALEWGYEADHPFQEHGRIFAASGIPFYVCPGTSAWNTLVGRTDNALKNLSSAAECALENGAIGYLNTDWGDSGHWQPYPVHILGFAAGAAYSWSVEASRDLDIELAVSRFGFEDPTGEMGRLAYELGNVYLAAGIELHNSSVAFRILKMTLAEIASYADVSVEKMMHMRDETLSAMGHLENERMVRPDAALIREEYDLAGRMVLHACNRAIFAKGDKRAPSAKALYADMNDILERYKTIWLQRNRPGGLTDSVKKFEAMLAEYKG